ncbi:MAG: ATP-dependent zinc metalloprotease FtsH [Firmicutes bacterium]|nr:ATP-dependent zinc metalloprotease FtsH [Bacillota bacterium]
MDMSTEQQQQAPQQRRRGGSSLFYIVTIVLVLFLIMNSMNACGTQVRRSTYTQFTRDIGLVSKPIGPNGAWIFETTRLRQTIEGETTDVRFGSDDFGHHYVYIPTSNIAAIVQQGNQFYVLRHGFTDPQMLDRFQSNPSRHATYVFHYTMVHDISAIWMAYNSFVNVQARALADLLNTFLTANYGLTSTDDDYVEGAFNIDPSELAGFLGNEVSPHANLSNEQWAHIRQVNTFVNQFAARYSFHVNSSEIPSNWFNFGNILSVLSIMVFLLVAFLIFRSFSSRGGLGNMGKNRATHTIGGDVKFANVAGIEEEKEQVMEIVDFLRNPKKFLDLGARIPKGVLLVGQPGTGKTLLAKAIAGEAGVHFFSISGSDFSEMLVGVGPSRMRDLFETAKANAPAIIFIDEIDSIARMRGVGVSGVSEENEQTLNQLLVQMDGFTKSEGVIVIAATNRPDILDQALLRPGRFDRQIVVQLPDVKGREQILKVHAKGKPLGGDVDLKRVAQIVSGFSGADIENLLNEAAIIAAKKDKRKISMSDITEGINKVILGPQKKSRIITEEDKKITAYHEAGHAIISRVLQPDQTVQEVSIIPRGMAAGYTLTNDHEKETQHKSKTELSHRLAMLMGGRVAEQLFHGDICTGASNDIKVATNLAEYMVTTFGMSKKLGPLYYGKEEEMALRLYNSQNRSEALQSVIDGEIKALIMDAEKRATEILTKHKSHAEVMKKVLLERETIYAADIALIMEGKSAKDVIKKMEERDAESKSSEERDRINSEIELLDVELDKILKHSKRYVEAKLSTPEKLAELEEKMEKARQHVRDGNELTQLPTLDNLAEYDSILARAVKVAEVTETEPGSEEKPVQAKKPTAPRKPVAKKPVVKTPENQEKKENE